MCLNIGRCVVGSVKWYGFQYSHHLLMWNLVYGCCIPGPPICGSETVPTLIRILPAAPPPATPSLCPGASLGLSLQHHKYLQLISGLRGLSVSDRPPLRTQEIPRSRPGIPKWPYLPQPSIELSSEWIPIKLIFCHQVYNTSPPTGLKC